MQEVTKPVNNENINRLHAIPGRKGFLPGNPGKPKGTLSYKTRVVNGILSCFGKTERRLFKAHLRNPKTHFEALDRILLLVGKGEAAESDPAERPAFVVNVQNETNVSIDTKTESGPSIS